MLKEKRVKYIRYDGEYLWLKVMVDETLISLTKLGDISTKKGHILKSDKLRAVKLKGEWIKI